MKHCNELIHKHIYCISECHEQCEEIPTISTSLFIYSHCDEIISQPLPVLHFQSQVREKHIFHNIKALSSGMKYAKKKTGKKCLKK